METFVLIKGGNHSQFGYLGTLLMDNGADISLEEQQQQILVNRIVAASKVTKIFFLTRKEVFSKCGVSVTSGRVRE